MSQAPSDRRAAAFKRLLSLRLPLQGLLETPKKMQDRLAALQEHFAGMKPMAGEPAAVTRFRDVVVHATSAVDMWRDHHLEFDSSELQFKQTPGFEQTSRLHHDFLNEAYLLQSPDKLREKIRPVTAEVEEHLHNFTMIPDYQRLVRMLHDVQQGDDSWRPLLDYLEDLERKKLSIIPSVAPEQAKGTGSSTTPRFRHVLIVEDNYRWQNVIQEVVNTVCASLDAPPEVKVVGDCSSARETVASWTSGATIAICDIGLPEFIGEEWTRQNGCALINDLSTRTAPACHVMALTSWSALQHDFLELHQCADDFIPKGAPLWRTDLEDRLRRLLTPLKGDSLPIIVPTFDAKNIRVGGFWVALDPMEFAIMDALANGVWSDVEGFVKLLPSFSDTTRHLLTPRRQPAIPFHTLKNVMCRREVMDLDADFMTKFNRSALEHHLSSLRTRVRTRLSQAGLELDTTSFLPLRGTRDEDLTLRLASPAIGCDTPEAYYAANRGLTELRVLVVEDNRGWLDRIVEALQRIPGCQVEVAENYEDALAAAPRFEPVLACLDLEIPRDGGAPKIEHGLDLRQELSRFLPALRFLVFTSHDRPVLRSVLAGTAPSPVAGASAPSIPALQSRDILLKSESDSLDKLFLTAWRIQQELQTSGIWEETPEKLHAIEVDTKECDPRCILKVNGQPVPTSANGSNVSSEHALVCCLALYSNQYLRREAIFDHLFRKGVGPTQVAELEDWLTQRIKRFRVKIEKTVQVPGEEVLAGCTGGYALLGNVRVV